MNINGKIHCFFEQSGTFKNEFKKLGFESYDYDIQNNFGETDNVIDLFAQIEKCYNADLVEREREQTIFDSITKDDLIIAFFPCIYFCESSMLSMTFNACNYMKMTKPQKLQHIIQRAWNREMFYELLLKLCYIVEKNNFRMIVENPYSKFHYLDFTENFPYKPALIDKNRWMRGDYFEKPTQYFFINCEPTEGFTLQNDKVKKTIRGSKGSSIPGVCSEERSMISSDYARNFICDNILGIKQQTKQLKLF